MKKNKIISEIPERKNSWIILGCNEEGYWIASKFSYRFKNDTERSMKLKWALQDAAGSIKTGISGTYTVAEV